MTRVALATGVDGRRWAKLRPLTGEDELAVDPGEPAAGDALLERLLVAATAAAPTIGPGSVPALSVADRDRLLAAVYRAQFGDLVEGVVRCARCAEPFEFGFSLDELAAGLVAGEPFPVQGPDARGYYQLGDGTRFRPPTGRDLEAVAEMPAGEAADALLARCVDTPSNDFDRAAVQVAMERLAPILNLDVDTECPHCGAVQVAAFDIERHLLGSLAQERRFLTHEVHRLAAAYGWGLAEILRMDRDDRRTLVRRVEAELGTGVSA